MKLLVDAKLSWRLIPILQQYLTACFHVDHLDELIVPAKDSVIWKYAKEYDLIIVTNDEDYVDLINLRGFPPKVVLLKTGNQSRLFISNLLIRRKQEIQNLQASTENGILEIVS